MTHMFYIALFRQRVSWFPSRTALAVTLAIGAAMLLMLWPRLDDPVLRAAVPVYVLMICLMGAGRGSGDPVARPGRQAGRAGCLRVHGQRCADRRQPIHHADRVVQPVDPDQLLPGADTDRVPCDGSKQTNGRGPQRTRSLLADTRWVHAPATGGFSGKIAAWCRPGHRARKHSVPNACLLPPASCQQLSRPGKQARQQGGNLARGQRSAEDIALHLGASLGPDLRELVVRLDTFGRRRRAKAARQSANSPHDGSAALTCRKIANKGSVDLDLVERKTVQIAQTGITRSKIVHRYLDAEVSKLGKNHEIRLAVLEKDRFGDLQFQPAWRQPRGGKGMLDSGNQMLALELRSGQIHGDRDVVRPTCGLCTGAHENPLTDDIDQSDFFGQRDEGARRHKPALWIVPT